MSSDPGGCVVIPFGVPTGGSGLGLGLAAVVHSSVRMAGAAVGIARLQVANREIAADGTTPPLEVFMTPDAWREMARRGDRPSGVGMVLTGAFEPPMEGEGAIRLLAFDARDGRTRATVDARVDSENAGASLVGAIEHLWSQLGGDIGALSGLRDLSWEVLESVLRAERCALHDPSRGCPHDGLAAMLHFGRAIADAPGARYPVQRLAAVALEIAGAPWPQSNLTFAAMRALEGAAAEASKPFELVEALGALLMRLGRAEEAEQRMNAAIAAAPERARPYAILSQALRAQGKLEGALAALDQGLATAQGDVALHVERGAVLAASGNADGALTAWRQALALDPLNPAAFGPVAEVAIRRLDIALAQSLIDSALAASEAHPEVLRGAIRLILGSEADGLARAARLSTLCRRVLERNANDAWVLLVSARAMLVLDHRAEARLRLERVERLVPESAAAADAQATRLALDNPAAERELESLMRAANTAPLQNLPEIIARARRLATEHVAWRGWLAAAIAERRLGRWADARAILEIALEIAPGAAAVRLEMAGALVALGDGAAARPHIEHAIASEGPSPRALGLLSSVVAAASKSPKKENWATRLNRMWARRWRVGQSAIREQ
jgi:tetratricopeptide (TPR) repeat protein